MGAAPKTNEPGSLPARQDGHEHPGHEHTDRHVGQQLRFAPGPSSRQVRSQTQFSSSSRFVSVFP